MALQTLAAFKHTYYTDTYRHTLTTHKHISHTDTYTHAHTHMHYKCCHSHITQHTHTYTLTTHTHTHAHAHTHTRSHEHEHTHHLLNTHWQYLGNNGLHAVFLVMSQQHQTSHYVRWHHIQVPEKLSEQLSYLWHGILKRERRLIQQVFLSFTSMVNTCMYSNSFTKTSFYPQLHCIHIRYLIWPAGK